MVVRLAILDIDIALQNLARSWAILDIDIALQNLARSLFNALRKLGPHEDANVNLVTEINWKLNGGASLS